MHPISVFYLARLRAEKLKGREKEEFIGKVIGMKERLEHARTKVEIEEIADEVLSLIRRCGRLTEEEVGKSTDYFENTRRRYAPAPGEELTLEDEKDLIFNELRALIEENKEENDEEKEEYDNEN